MRQVAGALGAARMSLAHEVCLLLGVIPALLDAAIKLANPIERPGRKAALARLQALAMQARAGSEEVAA